MANEGDYAQIVYEIMRCRSLQDNIGRCSLAHEDVQELKIKENFWKDVLLSWSKFNYHSDYRTENQILWLNSKLRIENKPFFWKDVYDRGLMYVHQLFHQCQYKSDIEMWNDYGLSKLRFNSIKSVMPKEWKNFFTSICKQQYFPLPPLNYDSIKNRKGFSREVYRYLAEDSTILVNKYNKWRDDLGFDICEDIYQYGKEHMSIYKITNVAKFRSFQYRLLQRGLVTNIQLEKWNILPSSNCSFCKMEEETVMHLMFSCIEVQKIWQDLVAFLEQEYEGIVIEMTLLKVLKNQICTIKAHVANFLCLITKQYLYNQRCLKKQLAFPVLKAYILKVRNIEKYIAIKNNKEWLFVKKWCRQVANVPVSDIVEEYIAQIDE